MKRREALKSLTLSTGLVISQASLIGLVQSCSNSPGLDWVPMNFTEEEASTVSAVCNVIIPKGADVGAVDMKVPMMIDKFSKDVFSENKSEIYKKGLSLFNQDVDRVEGKIFANLTFDQQNDVIKRYFGLEPNRIADILMDIRALESKECSEECYLYGFLIQTRELSISLYRTSRYVGMEMLNYDPIPGVYQGCIDYSTGDRPWSL